MPHFESEHQEQKNNPAPQDRKKTAARPPIPPASRSIILIIIAVLLVLLLIFILKDPAAFQAKMQQAASMQQQMMEQASSTPLMTDPGTTPPPFNAGADSSDTAKEPDESNTPEITETDAPVLEVHLLNVGQADSIFLRSPKGKTMLIDSGESQNFDAVCEFLESEDVKKLDVVVATHPHNDHIGSMYRILRKYDVGKFYMPAVTHTTETFERMLDALDDNDITPRLAYAKPNAKIAWGDGSVTARIVSPFEGIDYDLNNWSIVLHVSFGETSILLTGDAEEHAESVMLANLSAEDLDADVLKLGHHGSSTSTSEVFLDTVSPEIAVVSVGKANDYGHPHAETLKRLKQRDIPLYRTDKHGTISLILDGEDVFITTEK